jgi:hypothetical protein
MWVTFFNLTSFLVDMLFLHFWKNFNDLLKNGTSKAAKPHLLDKNTTARTRAHLHYREDSHRED